MAGKPELGIMAAAFAPQLEAETGKFRAGAESFAAVYAVEPEFSKAMDAFLADPEKNPPDLSEVMAFAVAIPVNSLGENAKKSGDWKMVEAFHDKIADLLRGQEAEVSAFKAGFRHRRQKAQHRQARLPLEDRGEGCGPAFRAV